MSEQLVEQFAELFQGRTDAVGLEEGGCWRITDTQGTLWGSFIRWHLTGERPPIGVYPMVQENKYGRFAVGIVRWGCIDFDEGEEESWVHAVNVRAVLEQFGITAWIERSRSKGFHVWVFIDAWAPARTVRRALLAACQLAGAPTREINPKQEELAEGQLGNYVRLPYPGHLSGEGGYGGRRSMIDPDTRVPHPVQGFVHYALGSRTNVEQLEKVAALCHKPMPAVVKRPGMVTFEGSPVARLSGLAYKILTEGPKEGVDRSTTLWKLATRIHDDGHHTFEEALDIMVQADLAWGKFMDRPNGEAELTRMLEKIWDD